MSHTQSQNPFAVRRVTSRVTSPVTDLAHSPRTYHFPISWESGEDQDAGSVTQRPPCNHLVSNDDYDKKPCAERDALEYTVASFVRRRQLEKIYAAELSLKRKEKERARRAHTPSRYFEQFLKCTPGPESAQGASQRPPVISP
jgi:hypothetical protein